MVSVVKYYHTIRIILVDSGVIYDLTKFPVFKSSIGLTSN